MADYIQLRSRVNQFAEPLERLEAALHIRELQDRYQELEQRAQEPDFWNDPQNAQKIQTQMKRMQDKVERFRALQHRRDELLLMAKLGEEIDDEEMAAEMAAALTVFASDFEAMRLETLFTGEYDDKNAILTLHAGAGGTEAMDWTAMLLRMYMRWAEQHGFEYKLIDFLDGEEAGLKSAQFTISGPNAYGYMRSEMGVHRLVRISPFDSSGRRHTSFASLEVIPELDDSIQIEIRSEDLRVDTYRASGAGGQHVNKTSSAVRMTHIPTGIVVACQGERSQIQNRETAMNMLKSRLFALAKSQHKDKIDDLKGDQMEIAWGSQIRSYVFQPYTMVKDHRTSYEEGDVDGVMDGNLDGFINAYLSDPEFNKTPSASANEVK